MGKKYFYFYPNDREKTAGILKRHPTIVFEDKQQIVKELAEAGMKVMCVSGTHNKSVFPSKNIEVISGFDKPVMETRIERLLGERKYECHKKEAKSAKFLRNLKN